MRLLRPVLGLVSILVAACSDDASGGSGGHGAVGGGGAGEGGTPGSGGSSEGGSSEGGSSEGGNGGAGGAPLEGTRVFVSSMTYTGDFGGLDEADATCQSLADSASLGGTWLAWMSETTFAGNPNPQTPVTRFVQSTLPYVLVGGEQIAADWTALTSGAIDAPIDHDETGTPIGDATPIAWTGTDATGSSVTPCCGDWSTLESGAGIGSTAGTDTTWSIMGGQPCSNVARLYCFEQ